MNRITENHLQAMIDEINAATGSPMEAYTNNGASYISNVGHYHLDSAYGGHSLVRMHNEHGGVKSIIDGFHTKREIFELMRSYLKGIEAGKQKAAA
jgi:hypothetical protein